MKNAYFVTSSIAGGKSSFMKIAKKLGFCTINADEIAHKLLNKYSHDIAKKFNDYTLIIDGKIDRKKLGNIVFNDNLARKTLEEYLHPKIKQEILKKAKKLDELNKAFFIELPLFFENDHYQGLGKSILIYAPKDLLIQRLMSRENIDKSQALKRINLQMDIEDKKKFADYIVENNSSYEMFEKNVLNLLRYSLKVF
ncbi:dephospho-CoA kinase [Campylobacter volucris]|uniref:Dephospho-CoA kinase n=1 Tax=Campylobacter volucris TaxID=1031542 RepID=A0A5C7E4S9_9BACT|nr:dephospho-CoA kinase [Campylobacter volucris]TXE88108.1 dephospho-CoA kinase [Campylobacter volucris]